MMTIFNTSGDPVTVSHQDALMWVTPAYACSENRAYHNMSHIYEVCRVIREIGVTTDLAPDDSVRQEGLLIAGAFHDVVYMPGSPYNEDASALIAERWLDDRIGKGHTLSEYVGTLILDTKNHRPDNNIDSIILIDADLWGLGASWDRYAATAANIRREFSRIPESEFLKGRAKFLNGMLTRDRIFWTNAAAQVKREHQARVNMERELGAIYDGKWLYEVWGN